MTLAHVTTGANGGGGGVDGGLGNLIGQNQLVG